jgi:hypothetical protein
MNVFIVINADGNYYGNDYGTLYYLDSIRIVNVYTDLDKAVKSIGLSSVDQLVPVHTDFTGEDILSFDTGKAWAYPENPGTDTRFGTHIYIMEKQVTE